MQRPTAARVGFIGLGMMARGHAREVLDKGGTIVAVCEPSDAAYAFAEKLFDEHGLPLPPNEPDWERFLEAYADQLDVVVIVTPHLLHFAQATACMEAGLDVILESRW